MFDFRGLVAVLLIVGALIGGALAFGAVLGHRAFGWTALAVAGAVVCAWVGGYVIGRARHD